MWASCFLSLYNLSTQNFLTRNLSTHNLSTHNLLTDNSTHIQLAHTQLYSHNSTPTITYSHNLSSHNLSSYNLLTHNSTHRPCRLVITQLLYSQTLSTCHHTTCSQTTITEFTHTQHLAHTSIFTLCDRHSTYGIGLAPVARLGRSGWGDCRDCWRGRYGTLIHQPCFFRLAFSVAGVVLGGIDLQFVWQE